LSAASSKSATKSAASGCPGGHGTAGARPGCKRASSRSAKAGSNGRLEAAFCGSEKRGIHCPFRFEKRVREPTGLAQSAARWGYLAARRWRRANFIDCG
jgi:hypothetical protein